ncbi:MAG: C40 family peptidase [Hyphomonas sp.]|nr:C40 family peptidase [Hyphomonas sp.]
MPDFTDKRLTPPPGTGVPHQILWGAAPLLEAPEAGARLSTEALHGELVDLYETRDGHGLVQCRRDRYVGWVPMPALSDKLWDITHRIAALRTHAYAAPDLKSPPRATLSLGALVHIDGEEGNWRHAKGLGWINFRHLDVNNIDPDGNPAAIRDPVDAALKFLHTPYLWGGRTSLGLDCTGLTQQAFEAAGVLLPRDSDMQFAWAGDDIPDWREPGALQRGDLVFWKGHAGLMADADTLIHCNAWHMATAQEPLQEAIVRIANYYAEPIGARRIDISKLRGQVPAWKAATSAA